MASQAVIGLGFGDEAKGLVTNYICPRVSNPLVVRYSGGHQAGHTVEYEGIKHVFSNFGSGTLQGVPTYWSEFCTVEPIGMMRELAVLLKKIKREDIKLYVNKSCPITTPYDIYANHAHEAIHQHGSVGVGFGKTLERNKNHYKLQFSDLFNPIILHIKMEQIRQYYNLHTLDVNLDLFYEAVDTLKTWKNIIIAVDEVPCYRVIKGTTTAMNYSYIFEGSQGLMLDKDYGFFPHVTRSNVGSRRLAMFVDAINAPIYYVTRAYQTRHGSGPMTGSQWNLDLVNTDTETNVINEYQGEFKRTPLDLNLLKYAHDRDICDRYGSTLNDHLVITCLDQMSKFMYTIDNKLFYAESEYDFVKIVSEYLNFEEDRVLLSHSPDSNLTKFDNNLD